MARRQAVQAEPTAPPAPTLRAELDALDIELTLSAIERLSRVRQRYASIDESDESCRTSDLLDLKIQCLLRGLGRPR